jgi:hypothetical protein
MYIQKPISYLGQAIHKKKEYRSPATETMLLAQCDMNKHQEYISNSFFAHHMASHIPKHSHGDAVLLVDVDDELHFVV